VIVTCTPPKNGKYDRELFEDEGDGLVYIWSKEDREWNIYGPLRRNKQTRTK
jgi:hypothetical protein